MHVIDVGARVRALHEEVLAFRPALCAERALLVTEFFRARRGAGAPVVVQKAEALTHVLRGKQVRIHPRELLVGCFTSHRVGGGLYPELHGVAMLEDLGRFDRRAVNPLAVAPADRRRLLREVLPFWLPRIMAIRALPPARVARFLADQLAPTFHLINETGGISHFVPDYQGTAIWTSLGAMYLHLLQRASPGSARPIVRAYRAAIERDGTVWEVYDGRVRPLRPYRGRLGIFIADEAMLWAAIFAEAFEEQA